MSKCLGPMCEREAAVRGRCHYCYQAISYLSNAGTLSQEELIKKGELLEPAKRGRKKVVHLTDAEHAEIITKFEQANGSIETREAYERAMCGNMHRRTSEQKKLIEQSFEKIEEKKRFDDIGRRMAEDAQRAEAQSHNIGVQQ